ncbi:hypothetical protein [Massilia orientalis]|uniref:Uncharacterized protein n=1 Tax=Massilia orientalis TaxID=3050128 RepID=A0ACC7MF86_9BURK|nr:hypothetical protein [Massilia sp. YIM B02787]
MFGNVRDPASPDTAELAPAKPMSPLGEQARAFFAGKGGKVSIASAPRPVRPGSSVPQRAAPAQVAAPASRSLFATSSDVARAREEQMAAEADIVDDTFDFDAPGC